MSRQYHRSHRWAWFFERPGYVRFMVRELTCFFVGGYLVVLLVTLSRLGGGEAAFAEWLASVSGPWWMIAHVVALVASVWHTVTWPVAAIVMGYGPWLTVTAVILWWVLR